MGNLKGTIWRLYVVPGLLQLSQTWRMDQIWAWAESTLSSKSTPSFLFPCSLPLLLTSDSAKELWQLPPYPKGLFQLTAALTQYFTVSQFHLLSLQAPQYMTHLYFRGVCTHRSLQVCAMFLSANTDSNPGTYCSTAAATTCDPGKGSPGHFPEQPPSDRKNTTVKWWDKGTGVFSAHQSHSDLLHFTVWTSITLWKCNSSARIREICITGYKTSLRATIWKMSTWRLW